MTLRRAAAAVAFMAGTAITLMASVHAAAPASTDLPLNVSVVTSQAAGGVFSDGAVYQNGQQNVRAVLLSNTNGNFIFDLNDKAGRDGGRRLVIVFPDSAAAVLAQAGTPTKFATGTPYYVDSYLGTLTLSSTTDSLRTMNVGDVQLRRGPISWTDGSLQYALRWSGSGAVGALQFTCVLADARGACSRWDVVPTGPAQFDSTPTKGGTQTVYGTIDMPLEMTLDKQ